MDTDNHTGNNSKVPFSLWGENGGIDMGIQGIGALTNLWQGFQANSLARKGLDQSKRQFDLNFGAQKLAYNNQLKDRKANRLQAAGVSNPAVLEAQLAAYMDQHGLA